MKHMIARLAILSAVMTLAACNEPATQPPSDFEIQLVNPVAWPGAFLVLQSASFGPQQGTPQVFLDSLPLNVTVVDAQTVEARLPDTSGTFQVTVRLAGGVRRGSVQVAGYVGRRTLPALAGWPLPLEPGSPVMIAPGESTLMRVNLLSGAVSSLNIEHRSQCSWSTGHSFRGTGVVAVSYASPGNCGRARVWDLAVPAAVVDSGPWGYYLTAELSPGTWLVSGPHNIWTFQNGATVVSFEQAEENEKLVFSPDRSRAVVLSEYTQGGLQVLDALQGTIAYHLPFDHGYALAYSPQGDTLFAALTNHYDSIYVRTVSASTGSPINETHWPVTMEPVDLVLDPAGPWFYVVGFGETPVVHVFDRGSLQHVAALRAPEGSCGTDCGYGRAIGVDPVARRLYVLTTSNWLGGFWDQAFSGAFDFTLPPASQSPQVLQP